MQLNTRAKRCGSEALGLQKYMQARLEMVFVLDTTHAGVHAALLLVQQAGNFERVGKTPTTTIGRVCQTVSRFPHAEAVGLYSGTCVSRYCVLSLQRRGGMILILIQLMASSRQLNGYEVNICLWYGNNTCLTT